MWAVADLGSVSLTRKTIPERFYWETPTWASHGKHLHCRSLLLQWGVRTGNGLMANRARFMFAWLSHSIICVNAAPEHRDQHASPLQPVESLCGFGRHNRMIYERTSKEPQYSGGTVTHLAWTFPLKNTTQDNFISAIFVPAPVLLPSVKRQLAKCLIRRSSHEVIELLQLPYSSITGEMHSRLYVPVHSCTVVLLYAVLIVHGGTK